MGQLTGLLPMRHTGITSALILSIWLAGLTSIVSSKDILLFYPFNLYKIQARRQTLGKNERLFQKYNPKPKTRHNYHQRMRMINNKNQKEEKRLTRTIFENFWGGSKRYTRGKQAFGSEFIGK